MAEAQKKDTLRLRTISESAATKADVVLLVVDASLDITKAYLDSFGEMAKIALDNSVRKL